MKNTLDIISVTKDDPIGILRTLESTHSLRNAFPVRQIIIDGSANEQNRNALQEKLKAEKNIQYIYSPARGIGRAFNEGLKNADAKWVWFLNGGDECHPSMDNDLFIKLVAASGADALIFDLEYATDKKFTKHPPLWKLWPLFFNWIPHPATLTKLDLYERCGSFDESYKIAMDGEFWIRCFQQNVVVDLISIPICRYDQTGVSSVNTKLSERESFKIILRHSFSTFRYWVKHTLLMLKAFIHYGSRYFH